jgi:CheY-like chemotaxis protein
MSKTLHVLIVEDTTDLGKELKGAILDLSTELSIMAAPSAEEGILEIGRHSIDLLVTDFRLPGISGLELVRRVQRKCPGAKIILTTAIVDAQLEKEAEDLQVSQVLKKPVDLAEFRKSVAENLGLEAISAPPPAVAPKTEPPQKNEAAASKDEDELSKALFKLHQTLKARCTMWMDSEGGIEKAFGDLPVDLPRDVIRQAAQKAASASHELGALILSPRKASSLYQPGISSDFLTVCSGEGMIAAVFSPGLDAGGVGEKTRILLEGYERIRNLATGGAQSNAKPGASLKPVAGKADLESLLKSPGNVSRSEADDFWESASSNAKPDLGNPDLLTYEQAQKMGLKVKK